MCVLLFQDDSALNVKVVVRLIENEKVGTFANATLLTADDGSTAVEQLRTEMAAGRAVHFVLMDFVMVSIDNGDGDDAYDILLFFATFLDYHERPRGSPHHERRPELPRSDYRYVCMYVAQLLLLFSVVFMYVLCI